MDVDMKSDIEFERDILLFLVDQLIVLVVGTQGITVYIYIYI